MRQEDRPDETKAGMSSTGRLNGIRAIADHTLIYGNRIGVLFSMFCAGIVFFVALHYMADMKDMANAGWGITHDAATYYQKIKWTLPKARYTATGLLELIGGSIGYVALIIPASLSALSFWRGGVRLIKLIAGR